MDERHPGTTHLVQMLVPNPSLPPRLAAISRDCQGLAVAMIRQLPDGPELTAGLRKLLEAKDCFVRAAL